MSMEVLDRHWQELLSKEGVLNTHVGTKNKGGVDTGENAIVVFVARKRPKAELADDQVIPEEIEGVKTDIIELAPEGWTAGKTEISQMHPADQLKRLGGKPSPKGAEAMAYAGTFVSSGASDLTAKANPIQNQGNCGACLSFDYTGVWEGKLNIVTNKLVKLSEAHLFFCDPVASCEKGSSPDDIITQALKGVALEADCPYVDHDQACGTGLAADWATRAKVLLGQNAISDPNQILSLLDTEPLVATMQVMPDFFNYTGGIYKPTPNQQPAGGHGVGCFGYGPAFKINRNQWGLGWGQDCVINGVARPGWFMIDPAALDPVMYQLILSDAPPAPPTPPSKHTCWLWNRLFGRKQQARMFGVKRSTKWPEARKEWLKDQGTCQGCGTTKHLEVHHMIPVHIRPDLELNPTNFITLCEQPGHDCHFELGHLFNWEAFNPNVQADAARLLAEVKLRRMV